MNVMNTYRIKRIDGGPIDWDALPKAEISHYTPNENAYYPAAFAQACHDGEAFFMRFRVEEPGIVATYREYNDPVSQDSCVEFFLNPYPQHREDYMNFETNVLGTLLLGFGYIRPRGRLWHILPERFDIAPSVKDPADYRGEGWEVRYTIPFALLNEVYGAQGLGSGSAMRGNFYCVCSQQGPLRHAGTWNPTAGFHDRFGFGELILE